MSRGIGKNDNLLKRMEMCTFRSSYNCIVIKLSVDVGTYFWCQCICGR